MTQSEINKKVKNMSNEEVAQIVDWIHATKKEIRRAIKKRGRKLRRQHG